MMKRHSEDYSVSNKRRGDASFLQSPASHGKDEIETETGDHFSRTQSQYRSSKQNVCPSETNKPMTVYPISIYDKNFPNFRQPVEIGHFSHDPKRRFKDDNSQLKCYCPPTDCDNVCYNLRHGYDVFNKRDDTKKEYLDDLLHWIQLHRNLFRIQSSTTTESAEVSNLSTDFVSWRGLYTKLLCTPYESRDGWRIAVTRHNSTWYLCEFDTPERVAQRTTETERQREMSYWGFKFEQYITAGENKTPNTSVPVNNHEAYCSIVRTRLNSHSLVFGGEVDCYETVNNKRKYIELKTSREMDHPRQMSNFKRFKLIKWWAQSFMIGIEKVVCGFRDDDGLVHRLQDYPTAQISHMCKDIPSNWEPHVCFNFLNDFLKHVKAAVTEDNPENVHLFSWRPREAIHCTRYGPNSEYRFLPDWFINNSTPT